MIKLNNIVVEFQTFPNNETRLDLDTSLLSDKNKVIWKFETNSDIFELLQFDAVMSQLDANYDLYIPYMPYSRMDRIQEQNTAFSLDIFIRTVINVLTNLEMLYIFDPHSPKTLELLTYDYTLNVNSCKELDFSLAKHVLDTRYHASNAWVVFPDKGAATRYNMNDYENVIVCDKVRDFKTGQITSIKAKIVKQNDKVKPDSPLYIIDDLCSKGGTFIGCLEAIRGIGITPSVKSLIVSHMEDQIYKGDVFKRFDTVYTTNSMWKDVSSVIDHHQTLMYGGRITGSLSMVDLDKIIDRKNGTE